MAGTLVSIVPGGGVDIDVVDSVVIIVGSNGAVGSCGVVGGDSSGSWFSG